MSELLTPGINLCLGPASGDSERSPYCVKGWFGCRTGVSCVQDSSLVGARDKGLSSSESRQDTELAKELPEPL